MYKTGDVARRMANGAIIYIGRADNQLKIKGYRVELSEIENAILTYPGITQAVASTRLNHDGQRHICGYFTTNRDLSASDLSSYLAERLPAYMIPRELVSIDKVPLTRNGKIDYRGLPEPELYHAKEIVMPANKVEESMLDAWKDILGGQLFGTKDNFFELGGDSIKAVQIASRLYAEGISVTIKDILVHQTIERISRNAVTVAMESHVDQGIVTGKKETTPIESWFFGRRFQVPGLFNQSILLCLSRPVPIKILEDAFKKIVEHHDGLRLNAYPETDMLFFNDDHLVMPIRIPVYELEAGITLEELCERIKGGFDLASSLLIRPAIINDGHSCFLFITAHHMVTDGVSWRVMLEDLYTLCTAALTGTNASLPPKTISLQEWSRKLSEYAASQELSSEESHWQGMENSIFSLIQDFETSDWSAGNLMKCTARLSKEQTAFLLTDANGVYKTDTSVLLITALAQALQDMTGLHSFVIEQENHGRQLDRVDASRTIGWLTSMYPVKIELCGNCIGDQVKSIREQLRRVPRGGIGYGICKQAGKLTNEFGRQLSEVRFNYLGQFDRQLNNDLFRYSEQTTGRDIAAENEITAKLEFNLMVIGGELIVEICYNRAAYKHSTIGELSRTFVKLLERILDHLKADSDMNFETSHFAAIGLKDEELNELFSE